jgi:hypothetical protein
MEQNKGPGNKRTQLCIIQMTLNKGAQNMHWRKASLTNGAGKTGYAHLDA